MEKRTIVITGSTRGIGLGLAKEFSGMGHQLIINGRTPEKVSDVVEELKITNPYVIGVAGNVSEEKTHLSIVEQAVLAFGEIDIWINNAGIPQPYLLFPEIESKDLESLIDINVSGTLMGTKTAVKHMIRQGHGKIFNMEGFGSDGRIMKKLTLYGTSKRAVHYFTKSISKELSDGPVKIGIISPGMVRTDFIKHPMGTASPEELKQFKKVQDILAEDVDTVVKFLVPRILNSSKQYARIEFLSKIRLIGKLIRMMLG